MFKEWAQKFNSLFSRKAPDPAVQKIHEVAAMLPRGKVNRDRAQETFIVSVDRDKFRQLRRSLSGQDENNVSGIFGYDFRGDIEAATGNAPMGKTVGVFICRDSWGEGREDQETMQNLAYALLHEVVELGVVNPRDEKLSEVAQGLAKLAEDERESFERLVPERGRKQFGPPHLLAVGAEYLAALTRGGEAEMMRLHESTLEAEALVDSRKQTVEALIREAVLSRGFGVKPTIFSSEK